MAMIRGAVEKDITEDMLADPQLRVRILLILHLGDAAYVEWDASSEIHVFLGWTRCHACVCV